MAEVLVVDDLRSAADEFARLVHLRTQLSTVATSSPAEALLLVQANPIRVAVLDERMPEKSGTELFIEIQRVDPLIKAIMLTAEAEARDVGAALKMGFSDYLHKSEVSRLPARVLAAYTAYEVDLAKKAEVYTGPMVEIVRKGLHIGHTVELKLMALEAVDEQLLFPDSWVTTKQLNAGEQIREVDKFEITNRFVYEVVSEERLASTLGVNLPALPKLKANLEASIKATFKQNVFAESRRSVEVVREYKLPPEPGNPDELHIISRHFQRAPVYRSIRCLMVKTCGCCGQFTPKVVLIYQLTSRVGTRQVDYLSDGSRRELATGTEVY